VGSDVPTSGLGWLIGVFFLVVRLRFILAFFILVFFALVFFALVFFALVFFALVFFDLRFLAMRLPLHLFEPSQITRFALHGKCGTYSKPAGRPKRIRAALQREAKRLQPD
jgi:hypothetical protein